MSTKAVSELRPIMKTFSIDPMESLQYDHRIFEVNKFTADLALYESEDTTEKTYGRAQ
jgi:hypothetical protein